ncbi:MAG: alpha-glucan family phosphorylase [Nitrospinota bacterium]|nr:alpha-glucan family phosphorylase [Nitrospinota bacterium]
MPEYRKFIVEPSLPEKLKPLEDIAYNLWWTWNHDAVNLLRRIDSDLWDSCNHNPVKVLGTATQERLRELAEDDGFLTHLETVLISLEEYLKADTWFKEKHLQKWSKDTKIAYFSLEFGIDECLPIYSGGLGVLAGDHLKSASDLGLPLVGIGLAYSHGYFTQYLNPDGWQQEKYPENSLYLLPLKREEKDRIPVKVEIPFPGRNVYAHIWKAEVGRIPLYLLDTNIQENSPEDRQITSQLYGGDREMRIQQEILLGIGGIKIFEALGLNPTVFHMNEGHSAFLGVERIAHLMKKHGFDFFEAKEACRVSTVFTTHTPVPAGNELFEKSMLKRYMEPLLRETRLDVDRLLTLGRINPEDHNEPFGMTVLALRLSAGNNGVSKLHGKISRQMWHNIWPGLPVSHVPIRSITNGIHIRTWVSEELKNLYERYLGTKWITKPGDDTIWKKIAAIPDAELWRMHERRRERLVAFSRKRLLEQLKKRGASDSEMQQAEESLNPEALTIGFGRRFATYKRGTLILSDLKRLEKILENKERPVQIIFAGKAHPADTEGKNFIKKIVHTAREMGFLRKIIFLENYDIDIARYMVQGCDIWLNNPRRPLEASGTSGMKAAANGVLNLSVLDGWWDEIYSHENGWAIGAGEEYKDEAIQDSIEGRNLYEILEKDIIPLFYTRGTDGLPRGWIGKMKSAMMNLIPIFNTNRMVREYTEKFYLDLGRRWHEQVEQQPEIIKSLAAWKHKLKNGWPHIKILEIKEDSFLHPAVGNLKPVEVKVRLGDLTPDDIVVECYYGNLDSNGEINEGKSIAMTCEGEIEKGSYHFKGSIPCDSAGLHGFAIRILPYHKNMVTPYIPGLIFWG